MLRVHRCPHWNKNAQLVSRPLQTFRFETFDIGLSKDSQWATPSKSEETFPRVTSNHSSLENVSLRWICTLTDWNWIVSRILDTGVGWSERVPCSSGRHYSLWQAGRDDGRAPQWEWPRHESCTCYSRRIQDSRKSKICEIHGDFWNSKISKRVSLIFANSIFLDFQRWPVLRRMTFRER